MTPDAEHDCRPLDNTYVNLPDDVQSMHWIWRCSRCNQKWSIWDEGRSRSARRIGSPSRRWRRDAWKRSAVSTIGGRP